MSLVAATVAVLLARQNAPENLVLISLTIGAAGVAGFALYRTLAPLRGADFDSGSPAAERAAARRSRAREGADAPLDQGARVRSGDGQGVGSRTSTRWPSRLRARAVGIMKQLDDEPRRFTAQAIERELQARLAAGRRAEQPGAPEAVAAPARTASARAARQRRRRPVLQELRHQAASSVEHAAP